MRRCSCDDALVLPDACTCAAATLHFAATQRHCAALAVGIMKAAATLLESRGGGRNFALRTERGYSYCLRAGLRFLEKDRERTLRAGRASLMRTSTTNPVDGLYTPFQKFVFSKNTF